ncbi:MAG: hypothetical protein KTR29_15670 [Rhodothermaceae bacterium]|nr:hypothetical protein [Rhodothermaceae bacterium]
MNMNVIALNLLLVVGSFALSGAYPGSLTEPHRAEQSNNALYDLVGTWKVDLRPTPDAAPYYQYLKITNVKNGRVEGTFYNSPIQYGNINDDWGKVVIAFITQDSGGTTYNTTIEVDGYTMTGTTHSLGRDFLSVWTGEKIVEE